MASVLHRPYFCADKLDATFGIGEYIERRLKFYVERGHAPADFFNAQAHFL
jgi:hypothetical protein